MNDIKLIEEADEVFYCVADPATIVWLKKLRPKAYDLYTLYDDDKVRYHTYMQMTEAMLYYTRQGKKVVGVFYGHPGIFVLSTHRAIAIAKREGLNAQMKASVSALDCLCSDLGVDPSHPGMVTYEATDMLIRLREPDTSLHCILWQVGLIAEMGYRRGGFINNNFLTLIQYLQKFYGDDFEIVHYIASRYPTIPSKIEKFKLSELTDSRIRKGITGLSTFYIPPKVAKQADIDMCIQLGLAKPGQTIRKTGTLRDIDKYNKREMDAVNGFKDFEVPEQYQYQKNTPVSEFLIELAGNAKLQDLYKKNPKKAVEQIKSIGLSQKDKDALISRSEGRIQIAAKQLRVRSSEQERFIMKLLSNQTLAKKTLDRIKKYKKTRAFVEQLEALAKDEGYKLKWKNIPSAVANVHATAILPWTGVYAESKSKNSIVVLGNKSGNAKSMVFVNAFELKGFSFNNYTLMWRKEEGNPHSGSIQFSAPEESRSPYIRSIEGKIWEDAEPINNNFKWTEQIIEEEFQAATPEFDGEYVVRFNSPSAEMHTLVLKEQNLVLNGANVPFEEKRNKLFQLQAENGVYVKGEINFLSDPFTGSSTLFGQLVFSADQEKATTCYGIKKQAHAAKTTLPGIPEWVLDHVNAITHTHQEKGGLMIYNQYAKIRFTGRIVSQIIKHSNKLTFK